MHFPSMESAADTILYFDGTQVYGVIAHSFAAFGGSYAHAMLLPLQNLMMVQCTLSGT